MERKTNPELIAHDVQNNELVENKRKELLGNLASSEYA